MSDCEIAEFYIHKEPVARKRHTCCECRAPIEVGEKYFHLTAKWDGRICRKRQHLLCTEACEYARDNLIDECFYYGELMEWFTEYWEDKEDRTDPRIKHMRVLMARILKRRKLAGIG